MVHGRPGRFSIDYVRARVYEAVGQVIPLPGAVAKSGGAFYRADSAGDSEANIRVLCLSLGLGDDHGKASNHCGCRSV